MNGPEEQLSGFISRFTPEIAARGRAVLDALQARIPSATRLVYDNYNALAVGFGPDARASNAILSVVFYPRWISFFFLQAAALDDPAGLFRGKGTVARHVVVSGPAELDGPDLSALIDQALAKAKTPLPLGGAGPLIIKSVSAKQRPRRP